MKRSMVSLALATLSCAVSLSAQLYTAPTMLRFNTDEDNVKIANKSLEFMKIIREDLRRNNDDYAMLERQRRLTSHAPPPPPLAGHQRTPPRPSASRAPPTPPLAPRRQPLSRQPPRRGPQRANFRGSHSRYFIDTRRGLNASGNVTTQMSTKSGNGTLFRSYRGPKHFKKVRVDRLKRLIDRTKTKLRQGDENNGYHNGGNGGHRLNGNGGNGNGGYGHNGNGGYGPNGNGGYGPNGNGGYDNGNRGNGDYGPKGNGNGNNNGGYGNGNGENGDYGPNVVSGPYVSTVKGDLQDVQEYLSTAVATTTRRGRASRPQGSEERKRLAALRQMPDQQSPSPDQLDMAPARGPQIQLIRFKGRLCQPHRLHMEGPIYGRDGSTQFSAFKPENAYGRQFPYTTEPSMILPRCCSCCKKSVLGCQ